LDNHPHQISSMPTPFIFFKIIIIAGRCAIA
jgi:hypothetical protein